MSIDLFLKKVETEPTPERVLELSRIVSKGPISEAEAKELFQPSSLNKDTPEFNLTRNTAIELSLIKKDDHILSFIGDKESIQSLDQLRLYCNSNIWKNEKSVFVKIADAFLESNEKLLKNRNLTSQESLTYLNNNVNGTNIDADMVRGFRFWISFLGFGYIQDNDYIYFLPNMYTALKDFIVISNFKQNYEYSVLDFVNVIGDICPIAVTHSLVDHKFNLAFSVGLRQLHNEGVLTLKRNLDSKEIWKLYHSNTHEISSEVTHIVFKGSENQ